jgi:hypothetical protein
MPNLYFCILWDLGVTYYILVRPGRETLTHYSSFSGGSGHVTPKWYFCIRWDLLVTSCIPVHPGRKT